MDVELQVIQGLATVLILVGLGLAWMGRWLGHCPHCPHCQDKAREEEARDRAIHFPSLRQELTESDARDQRERLFGRQVDQPDEEVVAPEKRACGSANCDCESTED